MRALRSAQNLVILAGYGLGAAALAVGIPEGIPPAWLSTPIVAFLLPTAAATTKALLRGFCVRHPVAEAGSMDVLAIHDAIMLRVIVFLVGVHAIALAGVTGLLHGRHWAPQVVPVMLGVTLMGVGNLLPRTRPNLAIGIRTARTLSDRALWIRTHRSLGYVVMALGLVIVVAALAVPPPIGTGMILLAGPLAMFGTAVLAVEAWR